MVDFAPAFTPVHSFLGGLMLATGVQHTLSQLGTVLGISGFFHESVACLVNFTDTSAPPPKDSNAIHHAISPEDDAAKQSDKTYAVVSRYLVNGILAGGAALAAARLPLESALGTSIFDSRAASTFQLGQGVSRGLLSPGAAAVYVPSALWGMAVGFGTKVSQWASSLSALSDSSFRTPTVGERVHKRPLPLRLVSPFAAFNRRNGHFLQRGGCNTPPRSPGNHTSSGES